MKQIILILSLVIVLGVVGILGFIFLQGIPVDMNIITPAPTVSGIEVFSPKPNEVISSPLKITGLVRGNGWTGFEGQVGTVKLFDSNNNELALGILTALGEWTTLPTQFETTINFVAQTAGPGSLVFYNENASGDLLRNKTFVVPVTIVPTNTMAVFVYFLDPIKQGETQDCSSVKALTRFVPKSTAPAKVALEELLQGPTEEEKTNSPTSIPSGVLIQSLTIANGVAKVDFNNALQEGVGGSCRVLAIRAQIEQTLKQFPTITSVVISINGKTEDILQP